MVGWWHPRPCSACTTFYWITLDAIESMETFERCCADNAVRFGNIITITIESICCHADHVRIPPRRGCTGCWHLSTGAIESPPVCTCTPGMTPSRFGIEHSILLMEFVCIFNEKSFQYSDQTIQYFIAFHAQEVCSWVVNNVCKISKFNCTKCFGDLVTNRIDQYYCSLYCLHSHWSSLGLTRWSMHANVHLQKVQNIEPDSTGGGGAYRPDCNCSNGKFIQVGICDGRLGTSLQGFRHHSMTGIAVAFAMTICWITCTLGLIKHNFSQKEECSTPSTGCAVPPCWWITWWTIGCPSLDRARDARLIFYWTRKQTNHGSTGFSLTQHWTPVGCAHLTSIRRRDSPANYPQVRETPPSPSVVSGLEWICCIRMVIGMLQSSAIREFVPAPMWWQACVHVCMVSPWWTSPLPLESQDAVWRANKPTREGIQLAVNCLLDHERLIELQLRQLERGAQWPYLRLSTGITITTIAEYIKVSVIWRGDVITQDKYELTTSSANRSRIHSLKSLNLLNLHFLFTPCSLFLFKEFRFKRE